MDMVYANVCCRLSLLEVVEGIGQHSTGRQGGGEASEDGEEDNFGAAGEAGAPGTSGEGCWLTMASGIAEEAAVSQVSHIAYLPDAVPSYARFNHRLRMRQHVAMLCIDFRRKRGVVKSVVHLFCRYVGIS